MGDMHIPCLPPQALKLILAGVWPNARAPRSKTATVIHVKDIVPTQREIDTDNEDNHRYRQQQVHGTKEKRIVRRK